MKPARAWGLLRRGCRLRRGRWLGEGASSGAGIGSGSREGDGGEDGSRDNDGGEGGGRRSGGESWISLRMGAVVQGSQLGGDSSGSMDDGGMDGSGDKGDGVAYGVALTGGFRPPHHPLAVRLHTDVSWFVLQVARWVVGTRLRLGRLLLRR